MQYLAGLMGAEAKAGVSEDQAAGDMQGYRKFGDRAAELDGVKCVKKEQDEAQAKRAEGKAKDKNDKKKPAPVPASMAMGGETADEMCPAAGKIRVFPMKPPNQSGGEDAGEDKEAPRKYGLRIIAHL